jgi:tRNA(adenine34) deaminase
LEDREVSVLKNIDLLIKAREEGGYGRLSQEAARRRLEWYDANRMRLGLEGSIVRRAYTLLLIRYLGLDPAEVPVIYEDEGKIVWRSFNFCPLLEACRRLGLDTREVCRMYQELPVSALISRIDPDLRFSRDYDRIRPYTSFCEEIIELRRAPPSP